MKQENEKENKKLRKIIQTSTNENITITINNTDTSNKQTQEMPENGTGSE